MPGPAPKPNAVNRNRPLANTVRLPAEGRSGAVPEWPLQMAEPGVWVSLWAMPQAVMWERMRAERTVARYAMLLGHVEDPTRDLQAAILGEVRQLEQQLGVTPKAMRDLRWEIVPDEVGEKRSEKADEKPAASKRRLTLAPNAVEA